MPLINNFLVGHPWIIPDEFLRLTCCDDTEDVELVDDEFSRFCRELNPFEIVLAVGDGVREFFLLLKLTSIDAISGDMFCGVLLATIVSGSSDIWKTRKS